MKIVLIEASDTTIFNIFQMAKMPRLGLPIIGRILKNLGHEVSIYVENIYPINWSDVFNADLVGISALTPTAPRAYEIAQRIRNKKKSISIVGGGPHFTFMPDEALDYFDYVVRGEGEKTMAELVNWMKHPNLAKLRKISGLSYSFGKNKFHNSAREFLSPQELDLLPFPDFSLIKGYNPKSVVPLQTSRGCPFPCEFCSVQMMWGRKYRFRSTDSVIKELQGLKNKFPKAKLFFYDDNFAADIDRAKILLREMIHSNLTSSWQTQIRADATRDLELMELMAKTGCKWLFLGLESVNPETLKEYKKAQTVLDIRQAINMIHQFGMRALGMFVIGSDSDDQTTAKKTAQFASKYKIDAIQLWTLGPLPGTPVFRKLEAEKRLLFLDRGVKKWKHYDGTRVVIIPKLMTPWQLQVSVIRAMMSHYAWKWFNKGWVALGKFLSPFHSWQAKKSSFESFVLSVYAFNLIQKAKKSLKDHLTDLKKLKLN